MSENINQLITNEDLNELLGIEQIQNLELTDPSYTRTLNEYLHILQNNIEKILSVPFLQGQKGESILVAQFRLFEIGGSPTDIGKEVLKALFPLAFSNVDPGSDWKAAVDSIPTYATINNVHAYNNLEDTTTVDLYYTLINQYEGDTEENRNPLQSASYFVFYDARLAEISGGTDSNEFFKDTSAAIFRQYTGNSNYEFVNSNLLPTIYYDVYKSKYCWSVNGIPTGIPCEGIKGEEGDNGTMNIVKLNTESPTIVDEEITYAITAVYTTDNNSWSSNLNLYLIDETSAIGVIYNEDPENNNNTNSEGPDIYFGITYKSGTDWRFKTSSYLSILSLVSSMSAQSIFDSIMATNTNTIRGMYVKDAGFTDSSNSHVHALYSNSNDSITLAPVAYDWITGGSNMLRLLPQTFNIRYNDINLGNIGRINYIISSGASSNNTMEIAVTSLSGAPKYLKLTNYNNTDIGTSILMKQYGIDINGATIITGDTTINGKTEITRNSTWGESLTLNNTTTLFHTQQSEQIRGTFVINNTINVNTGTGSVDKIYALKINNNGSQKRGIHCTGQCEIIGITNIKNSDSNTMGQVSINATGVTLIGDTTTIENKSTSPDGKVTINRSGINLTGATTIQDNYENPNERIDITNTGITIQSTTNNGTPPSTQPRPDPTKFNIKFKIEGTDYYLCTEQSTGYLYLTKLEFNS